MMQNYKNPLIFVIILIFVVIGAYLGYQYYLKFKILELPKSYQEEQIKQENLLQSISPVVSDQKKIFTDEEKKLIKSVSPAEDVKTSTEASDEEMQKLIDSIMPKK